MAVSRNGRASTNLTISVLACVFGIISLDIDHFICSLIFCVLGSLFGLVSCTGSVVITSSVSLMVNLPYSESDFVAGTSSFDFFIYDKPH